MRRVWCWVFLLSSGAAMAPGAWSPAMAQSAWYNGAPGWDAPGWQPPRAQPQRPDESRQYDHHQSEHHQSGRHRRGLTVRAIEPSRLGPAPVGFWYRCDSPAGYYPYIPACQAPWRIVPSAPPR